MENSTQATVAKAAIYVDLKRCIGCDSCSLACKQEFNVELGNRWSEIYGAERGTYPSVNVQVLPMRCQQCGEAKCQEKCDSLGYKAIQRRPDGIVYVNPALCVGCQKCIPECPYKAMSFNTQKTNKLGKPGVADKCNFCMNRLDQGLLPACVITCLGVTLEYGDFDALRAKYPNAKEMHDRSRMLYGNMGEEPKHRTAGYPDPTPFHD